MSEQGKKREGVGVPLVKQRAVQRGNLDQQGLTQEDAAQARLHCVCVCGGGGSG